MFAVLVLAAKFFFVPRDHHVRLFKMGNFGEGEICSKTKNNKGGAHKRTYGAQKEGTAIQDRYQTKGKLAHDKTETKKRTAQLVHI